MTHNTGTALLVSAVVGVVLLLFDVLRGRTVGITSATITAAIVVTLWVVVPWALRSKET